MVCFFQKTKGKCKAEVNEFAEDGEMGKRVHLYVNRRNIAVWLMVLCMFGSIVVRIALPGVVENANVWWQIGLPVAAAVLYALIVVFSGDEMFYKTAIPVWVFGVSYVCELKEWLQNEPLWLGMACVVIPALCLCYTLLSDGRLGNFRWLIVLYLIELVGLIYFDVYSDRNVIPAYLAVAGRMILLFAVKVNTPDEYHPTWGDRIDGRRIRTAPALEQIAPYIMVNRNGANNLFSEAVEITEMEQYVSRKRQEGLTGFGAGHVIMAAYVRTVAKYPALNRFVAGQKVYSRGEDIVLCMTVKKEMTASSPDTVIKVHLNPQDTAVDVYKKFQAQLEEAKDEMSKSDVDNTAGAFMMIPGLLIKFIFWLLRVLDYFGLVPRFLLEVSPFHGSVYFTSMGSLGIKPVYHHLYDFGTIPAFCAFGHKRRAEEIVRGAVVERKYMDLRFNLDERICDGYYYASVIKYFLRILKHPAVLDEVPEVIEKDIP